MRALSPEITAAENVDKTFDLYTSELNIVIKELDALKYTQRLTPADRVRKTTLESEKRRLQTWLTHNPKKT